MIGFEHQVLPSKAELEGSGEEIFRESPLLSQNLESVLDILKAMLDLCSFSSQDRVLMLLSLSEMTIVVVSCEKLLIYLGLQLAPKHLMVTKQKIEAANQ